MKCKKESSEEKLSTPFTKKCSLIQPLRRRYPCVVINNGTAMALSALISVLSFSVFSHDCTKGCPREYFRQFAPVGISVFISTTTLCFQYPSGSKKIGNTVSFYVTAMFTLLPSGSEHTHFNNCFSMANIK